MAQGMTIAELKPGMTAELEHKVSESDIVDFARVTGDTNPVHMDQAYAEGTMFKGRIAHGMLSAGYISAVLGTRLPGPGAIYMSQTMMFKAPVRIGDTVTTRVTVKEVIADKKRVKLETICLVGGKPVVEGEALLMLPGG
jgi:3-hydroxybutyryl-CoA dehydratase